MPLSVGSIASVGVLTRGSVSQDETPPALAYVAVANEDLTDLRIMVQRQIR